MRQLFKENQIKKVYRRCRRLWKKLVEWVQIKKIENELNKELKYFSTGTSKNYADIFATAHHTYHFENETDRLYAEGILRLKNSINELVKTKTKAEYHRVLEEVEELLSLAQEETVHQKALRHILHKIYVAKGSDIKSKKDKMAMIEKRINHYKELQNYKVERKLRKDIREAYKNKNTDLAKKLEKEWKDKYGNKKS